MDIFQYYKDMQKDNIVLFLNGFFDQNMLVSYIELIKEKLTENYIRLDAIKKILFIIIEFSQNIMRYSMERLNKKSEKVKVGKGIVIISETKGSIVLTASNVIKNRNIRFLKQLCDTINTTDKMGLKQFYKNNLNNNYNKNRYNANIGLIHIVRKTEYPLVYFINKINDENSLFTVSVTVDKGEKGNYFKF